MTANIVNKIQLYATLHSQKRDHEDEITITFKCAASEFDKAVGIPTQVLLIMTLELCPNVTVNQVSNSLDTNGNLE